MDDLILRTRFDVLRRNLERVADVGSSEEGSVEHLRSELRRLLDLPTDPRVTTPLTDISSSVAEAKRAIWAGDAEKIWGCLNSVEAEVEKLRDQLAQAQRAARLIEDRALPIRGEGSPWPALEEGLVDEAKRQIEALNQAEAEKLGAAAEAERRNEHDRAAQLKKDAWTWYSQNGYVEGNQVFTEYLDFLSGLALRDSGLDQGLCRIADKLIRGAGRLPGGVTWDSLTIPAQREALRATLAKFVRLGFPEWTVWALPLAAHELGHVAVTIDPLRRFIDEHAQDEDEKHRLRMCLADAFATFVLGPAYACAVILIRLDPLTAFDEGEGRLNQKRARVVLTMLEYMNRGAPPTERPYERIAAGLEAEWNEALLQAGSTGSLTEAEERDVSTWVELMAGTMRPLRALPSDLWPRIEEVARHLDDAHVDTLRADLGDDLRIVLNAAWKRRMEEQDHGKLEEVASAAMKAWQRIDQATRPTPSGRFPALSGLRPPTP